MTAQKQKEMHDLVVKLEVLTRGTSWEAVRCEAIGFIMKDLSTYCATCDCREVNKMMIALLKEAKRTHHRGYLDESCDHPPCPRCDESEGGLSPDVLCDCGADEWNKRIDAIINGNTS